MKTHNFLIALLFCLVVNIQTVAAQGPQGELIVRLTQSGPSVADLQIANLQLARTKIVITDLNGKTWFSEWVNKENGYARKLDLSKMPAGNFLLVVRNKEIAESIAFALTEGSILAFHSEGTHPEQALLTANEKPEGQLITYLAAEDEQSVGVRLANLPNQTAKIHLSLLDGTILWKEEVADQYSYAKKINLQGLDTGSYYLVIQTESTTQIQFFRLTRNGIQFGEKQIFDQNTFVTELAGH